MICLSSAGSLASFDGGFRGARPLSRGRPRAGTGGPRSPGRERRGAAHAVGSRGGTRHASAGGLVVDLALRRGRGLDAAAALARQPWAGARGSLGSPARPPAPETREQSSLAPRRMGAPLEETCVRAEPGCAICVQRFDDSLNSAIRTTYRISLRSSSLREPRYPSARVVFIRCELTSRLPPTRRPESTGRRDDDKGRTDAARRDQASTTGHTIGRTVNVSRNLIRGGPRSRSTTRRRGHAFLARRACR